MTARELEIPMIADAPLDPTITDGTSLTVHGDRAVVYEGDLLARSTDTR
jgi:pyruvate kinase